MFDSLEAQLGSLLRWVFEYSTGWNVYTVNPPGVSFYIDLDKRFSDYNIISVFDVGANKGQSAINYTKRYGNVDIHSFEPIKETFDKLKENTKSYKNIKCVNLAMGNTQGKKTMVKKESSDLSYIKGKEEDENNNTEEVEICTIDDYACQNNIDRVSLLKIDTEGYDLEVIKGAKYMLKEKKVDFVQVEAGVYTNNEKHVDICKIRKILEEFDYHIFGIYNQARSWTTRENVIRRCDFMFIAKDLAECYNQE